MTKLDLEPIKERERHATLGPWSNRGGCAKGYIIWMDHSAGGKHIIHTEHPQDAAFCAHARQDIPALIAEIDRLQARAQKVEQVEDVNRGLIDECKRLNVEVETWRRKHAELMEINRKLVERGL